MKGLIPYTGFQLSGGAGTQALSSSLAPVGFTALGFQVTDATLGDAATRPDLANNRLILGPGTYEIEAEIEGVTDGAQVITLSLTKNGVIIPGTTRPMSWAASSAENLHNLQAVVTLTDADVPGAIPTFPDPPASSFTGAGGAPKMGIPVQLGIQSTGTPTITVKNGLFFAKRIG